MPPLTQDSNCEVCPQIKVSSQKSLGLGHMSQDSVTQVFWDSHWGPGDHQESTSSTVSADAPSHSSRKKAR